MCRRPLREHRKRKCRQYQRQQIFAPIQRMREEGSGKVRVSGYGLLHAFLSCVSHPEHPLHGGICKQPAKNRQGLGLAFEHGQFVHCHHHSLFNLLRFPAKKVLFHWIFVLLYYSGFFGAGQAKPYTNRWGKDRFASGNLHKLHNFSKFFSASCMVVFLNRL